jgi:hypothetical protein
MSLPGPLVPPAALARKPLMLPVVSSDLKMNTTTEVKAALARHIDAGAKRT